MAVVLGTDGYRYEVQDNWAKLPAGMEFNADVAAVGVDQNDNVYAFNRGKHPMCVFDRDGNLLRTWGEGIFLRPHGVFMAPDGTIWLTDDGDHTVRQCTLDGKVLLTIGVPGKPAPYMSGEPFHRCTHTAMSPDGDTSTCRTATAIRASTNTRSDGKLRMSWGEPGTDPGQFNIAHNVCCDPDGWVYVADRENHRVQVFDGNGKYEASGTTCTAPPASTSNRARTAACISARSGPTWRSISTCPNCGPRVSIYTATASCWRGSATSMRGSSPASSSRRTGSPSTRGATSMSARSATPIGAAASGPRASSSRRACAACKSW